MSGFKTSTIVAVALTVTAAVPAFAQTGGRYATDPDRFIWSQLGYEHRALSHQDAVLPPTARAKAVKQRDTVTDGRYATDPDSFIWSQLGYEHRALSHQDAVLPRSSRAQALRARASAGPIAQEATGTAPFSYSNTVTRPW